MARLLLLAIVFALLPATASALEIRTGGVVAIRESEHVADDLLAIGGTVSVLGRVDGDVYALGQLVAIGGQIAGDVIAAGPELRIGGRIGGDVRALGDLVQVLGAVDRNVLAAGRQLRLMPAGRVGGSWTGWAEEASVGGPVGRALWLTAGSVRIDAAIGGPARVMADRVALGPAARVPGGLEYSSPADATVAAGAQAPGMVRHEPRPSREVARVRELAAGAGRLMTLGLLGSSLVAALVLGALAPRAPAAAAGLVVARPLRTLSVGLAVLVVPLPVALVLGLTVLGLPLAVGIVGMWGLVLGVGWLLAGAAFAVMLDGVGRGSSVGVIRESGTEDGAPVAGALREDGSAASAGVERPAPRGAMLAALRGVGGAAVLWLAGQVPVVGTVVTVGAFGLGAGALLTLLRRARLAP